MYNVASQVLYAVSRELSSFAGFCSVSGEKERNGGSSLRCKFCPGVEKLFITNGKAVGLRKDLNGVLLLDSILQPPFGSENCEVLLELTLSDVRILFQIIICWSCSCLIPFTLRCHILTDPLKSKYNIETPEMDRDGRYYWTWIVNSCIYSK